MDRIRPSLKHGIFTGIFLILYFLLISLFDLSTNPVYSFFNVFICGMGIYFALNEQNKKKKGFKYITGFKTGLLTGFYATVIFSIFFAFYANYTPGFAQKLTDYIGFDIAFGLLVATVAVMGLASVLIITFTLMQVLKRKWYLG